jgi:translation elongation factor EF-Tu-like GTPase
MFGLIIQDVYEIKGRGTVVFGTIAGTPIPKVGEWVDIESLTGLKARVQVGGVEYAKALTNPPITLTRVGDSIGLQVRALPYKVGWVGGLVTLVEGEEYQPEEDTPGY